MPHLSISRVGRESEAVVGNLFQHYLRDMAEWFEIDVDRDGRYVYDMASIWRNYEVYLASVEDGPAGFVLLGSAAEWLGDAAAHDIHEFFVGRKFRRRGLGKTMAVTLWNERPGAWLVRVLEANAPAVLFWRSAIAGYSRGAYEEQRRMVNERPWRFFRFVSNAA